MPRKLKHHEQKLLKKTNLYAYKNEHNEQEIRVLRKYLIQRREDYSQYNKMCGMIHRFANEVAKLDPKVV